MSELIEDRFYVIRCSLCGNLSIQEIRGKIKDAVFCCKHESCQRSRKIKKVSELGLNLKTFGPYTVREASYMIQQIKEQLNKSDISDNFRTYYVK